MGDHQAEISLPINCRERISGPSALARSPDRALSARGISIATAKTSVNVGRHRRTYRQEPGHKAALALRLRKLSIDGEKTLQEVAELAYQRSIRSRRRPLLGPVCPRNELVFLTYFTTLRLTIFVRRCTVCSTIRKRQTAKVVYGAPPDFHEQIGKMLPDLMR